MIKPGFTIFNCGGGVHERQKKGVFVGELPAENGAQRRAWTQLQNNCVGGYLSESLREEHGPAQTVDKVVSRGAYAVCVGAAYPLWAVWWWSIGRSVFFVWVEWNIYARCDMSILRRLSCRRLGLSRWTGGCAGARLQQQLTLPASSIFI